jgi:hypothetical protein
LDLPRLVAEARASRVQYDGDPAIRRAMEHCLKLRAFAQINRRVAGSG